MTERLDKLEFAWYDSCNFYMKHAMNGKSNGEMRRSEQGTVEALTRHLPGRTPGSGRLNRREAGAVGETAAGRYSAGA